MHPIAVQACVQVQGTDEPYVLWSKKKALTASQYTTRLEELKTDHEFVLQLVQIHFWKMMDVARNYAPRLWENHGFVLQLLERYKLRDLERDGEELLVRQKLGYGETVAKRTASV